MSVLRLLVRLAPPVALLAVAAGLWQLITTVEHVPDFLLPGPAEIWQTMLTDRDLLLSSALPTAEIAVRAVTCDLPRGHPGPHFDVETGWQY